MATWQCPQEWSEWVEWLAAGLHGRCRWRLPILLGGILFATGRRTAASWLRAAGISTDFSDYYYFIAAVGRKAKPMATRLLLLLLKRLPSGDHILFALDDTPTKRYGPKVQGAGIHHNPTPGPADAKFLYGHIWVTLAWVVRHPLWGTIGLPLRAALYIRQKDIASLPEKLGWKFQTKLQQGAALVVWAWLIVAEAGKRLWIVADGAYAKRPFLKPLRTLGVVVVSRLRKDAALVRSAAETQEGTTTRTWPAADLRQEADQPGQAGRRQTRLANHRVRAVRQNGDQEVQELPGHLPSGLRHDPRGDRAGARRLRVLLLDRPGGERAGDLGSVCRSVGHRTGLPRHQGSLGGRQAATSLPLGELRRLSSEPLDAHPGGTVGLEPCRHVFDKKR